MKTPDFPALLTVESPVLILHHRDAAGDDREQHQYRTERQRGDARESLADGATQAQYSAEAHQYSTDDVVDHVLGIAKALQSKTSRPHCPQE